MIAAIVFHRDLSRTVERTPFLRDIAIAATCERSRRRKPGRDLAGTSPGPGRDRAEA